MSDSYVEQIEQFRLALAKEEDAKARIDAIEKHEWTTLPVFAEVKQRFSEGSRLLTKERYAEAVTEFEAVTTMTGRLDEFLKQVASCVDKYRELDANEFIRSKHLLAAVAKDENSLLDMFHSEQTLDQSEETVRMIKSELERIEEGAHVWINLLKCRNRADKRFASLFDQIEKTVSKAVLSPETNCSLLGVPFRIDFLADEEVQQDLINLQTIKERLSVQISASPFCMLKMTETPSFEKILTCPSKLHARRLVIISSELFRGVLSALERFHALEKSKTRIRDFVESLGGIGCLVDQVRFLWKDFFESIDDNRLKKSHWTEASIIERIDKAKKAYDSLENELLAIVCNRAEAVKCLLSDYSRGSLQGAEATIEPVLKKKVGEILRWEQYAVELRPDFSLEWKFEEDPCKEERFSTENMFFSEGDKNYHLSFSTMEKRAENHPDVACLLAILSHERNDFDVSRNWLKIAVQKRSPCGMNNYGVFLFRQKRYAEAKEWFDKAAQSGNKYAVQNARMIRPFVS